jgi:hypothetical protein
MDLQVHVQTLLCCAVIGLYVAAGALTYFISDLLTWGPYRSRGVTLVWSIFWPVMWLIIILLSLYGWLTKAR